MDKEEESYSGSFPAALSGGLDYQFDHHQFLRTRESSEGGAMVDYMLANPQLTSSSTGLGTANSPDRLSFADVMQFAEYGTKNVTIQNGENEGRCPENGLDPVYFLKFPVLNEKIQDPQMVSPSATEAIASCDRIPAATEDETEGGCSENASVQFSHRFDGSSDAQKLTGGTGDMKNNRRKRPRSLKTTEEVESQRMTHIAVERNRRRQMNEHLRVLRSLMPGSYVQRGDQASIIGGAIEFVRELEQLLQCLESQKRRRMLGGEILTRPPLESSPPIGMPLPPPLPPPPPPPLPPPFYPGLPLPGDQLKMADYETGLREEMAENKSCLADIEVKLLGFDAMIKILSRRRPGQLLKTIAALEDLQLNILHTNITTIEQTVLYSFNVKIVGESRLTAEDIANSVQQIFSFIHASATM
ncbi:transcription factor FAMA isoform X2 [Nymphaea colorata]|uniref:transcription factor FAMA isoform X2 n=1 Tax=Nymphaea colorata TaxID=210225 RepID=UPI00129EAA0C|nr:transcription factor FAMA isoform X2 [Nymphaea colorata]